MLSNTNNSNNTKTQGQRKICNASIDTNNKRTTFNAPMKPTSKYATIKPIRQ